MRSVIYKYLPRRFADRFVQRGEVLFRTLSYFRKVEHAARGDEIEGIHIDAPANPATLENLTTFEKIVGPWKFLNSIDQSSVYAWCSSTVLSRDLFDTFEADRCVAIHDVNRFFLRCQTAARKAFPTHRPILRHREVAYWSPAAEAPLHIKDAANIPFLKHEAFAPQAEYRGAFALKAGQHLQERIVYGRVNLRDEIVGARTAEKLMVIGNLADICEVLGVGDVPR